MSNSDKQMDRQIQDIVQKRFPDQRQASVVALRVTEAGMCMAMAGIEVAALRLQADPGLADLPDNVSIIRQKQMCKDLSDTLVEVLAVVNEESITRFKESDASPNN